MSTILAHLHQECIRLGASLDDGALRFGRRQPPRDLSVGLGDEHGLVGEYLCSVAVSDSQVASREWAVRWAQPCVVRTGYFVLRASS